MLDILHCVQPKAILIPFAILDTAGVPSVTEGSSYLSVVDGVAGVYAITFAGDYFEASARTPVILGATAVTATGVDLVCTVVSPSATGFTIEVSDNAGTLTDSSFHGAVLWFGTADER